MTLKTHIIKPHIRTKSYDFGASQWKHVMKLLGLVVVADGRVFPETVEAYVKAMRELTVVIDPSIVMTSRMIKDWLSLNKESLLTDVNSLEYDSVLIETLSHMKFLPYKLDVVTAMMRVAIADGDYSDMKKMFIKKTILYWNIRA